MSALRRNIHSHNICFCDLRGIYRIDIIFAFLGKLLNIDSDGLVHPDARFITCFDEDILVNDCSIGHNAVAGNCSAVYINICIRHSVCRVIYLNTKIRSTHRQYGIGCIYDIALALLERLCKLIRYRSALKADSCRTAVRLAELFKQRAAVFLKLYVFIVVQNKP